jgi:hypothetical protein
MTAALHALREEGAEMLTTTADGTDLEGTSVSKGVRISDAGVALEHDWYSGYLRIATNEKSMVRSYFTADTLDQMQRVEARTRMLYTEAFGGTVVD